MNLYVIAGPNGSGKTTGVTELLPAVLNCEEYINAEMIAKSLSFFHPERVAGQAVKLAFNRLKALACKGVDFVFESTLASRTLLRYLKDFKKRGYTVNILYLWLENSELAVRRVQDRAFSGGQGIPEEVITRRYKRSLDNFKNLYLPIADNWILYNNSGNRPLLVARQHNGDPGEVIDQTLWNSFIGWEYQ